MTEANRSKHSEALKGITVTEAREYCRKNRLWNRIVNQEDPEDKPGHENTDRVNLIYFKNKVVGTAWG